MQEEERERDQNMRNQDEGDGCWKRCRKETRRQGEGCRKTYEKEMGRETKTLVQEMKKTEGE